MAVLPKKPGIPEWVTSEASLVNGLDLLGLRIPVERIGQGLLGAVTTISPTIRYISLRAWISRRYAVARLPNSWKAFREFAGRVEAAVAIGNLLVDERTTGLVGPDEGRVKIQAANKRVKLEALVKQLALAAYAGPSDALQIPVTVEESEVPGLSAEWGLPLAEGVEELVKDTVVARALSKDPSSSEFSREDLREFGASFTINSPAGKEREVLISCLFPDAQGKHVSPLISYRLLLELARSKGRRPLEDDVFEAASRFDRQLGEEYESCLDGWLWYSVRDSISACHEAVLACVVDKLNLERDAQAPTSLLGALLNQHDELENALRDVGVVLKGKSWLDQPLHVLSEHVRDATKTRVGNPPRWRGQLQESAVIRCSLNAGPGSLALLPLAWLLVRERTRNLDSSPVEIRELLSYQGSWRLGIEEVIRPTLEEMLRRDVSLRTAAYELALRTVGQHMSVAWGRLRSDPRKDVSVVTEDGNAWSARKRFRAGQTASRLPQAIGWLFQLGLISDAGCTKDGERILNRTSRGAGVGKQ